MCRVVSYGARGMDVSLRGAEILVGNFEAVLFGSPQQQPYPYSVNTADTALRLETLDVLNAISSPALVHDQQGRIVLMNHAAERRFKELSADARDQTLSELFPASPFGDWKSYWEKCAGTAGSAPLCWPWEEPGFFDAEVTAIPATLGGYPCALVTWTRADEQADEVRSLRTAPEIMDRRSLDASETSFFRLTVVQDTKGEVVDFIFADVNLAGSVDLGMDRDQILGSSITHLGEALADEDLLNRCRTAFTNQVGFRREFLVSEGCQLSGWYKQEVVPLEDGVGIFHYPISELKSAEEWLRESLQALPEPVLIIDQNGMILEVNAAAAQVFQYRPSELLGASVERLVPQEHAERRGDTSSAQAQSGFAAIIGRPRELLALNKSGEEFPIRLAIGEMNVGERKAYVASVYDLRELRALKQELRQSQKMDALGRLAAGVAHDFNNLLVVINQNALMLEGEFLDPRSESLVAEIREAGRRGTELSKQLLQFSRRETGEPRSIDAKATVDGVAALARRLLPETHRLSVQLPSEESFVSIDPGQLEQVLLNLIINARDAMPKGGTIALRVSQETGGPGSSSGIAALSAIEGSSGSSSGISGPSLLLELADQGEGIPAAIRSRIFDPFFTTKEHGRGTGLGLATVFGIVDRAGGRIDVESESGRGSIFSVRLPLAERPLTTDSVSEVRVAERAPLNVALVEDDPLVRSSMRRWLRSAGHRVTTFESGENALHWLQGHLVDVLLTDVIMPTMTGPELALAVARTMPELPIVFLSGHTEDLLDQKELPERAHFLAKPFAPEQLNELLAKLTRPRRGASSAVSSRPQ